MGVVDRRFGSANYADTLGQKVRSDYNYLAELAVALDGVRCFNTGGMLRKRHHRELRRPGDLQLIAGRCSMRRAIPTRGSGTVGWWCGSARAEIGLRSACAFRMRPARCPPLEQKRQF